MYKIGFYNAEGSNEYEGTDYVVINPYDMECDTKEQVKILLNEYVDNGESFIISFID